MNKVIAEGAVNFGRRETRIHPDELLSRPAVPNMVIRDLRDANAGESFHADDVARTRE